LLISVILIIAQNYILQSLLNGTEEGNCDEARLGDSGITITLFIPCDRSNSLLEIFYCVLDKSQIKNLPDAEIDWLRYIR
jgi:hypothetical protein